MNAPSASAEMISCTTLLALSSSTSLISNPSRVGSSPCKIKTPSGVSTERYRSPCFQSPSSRKTLHSRGTSLISVTRSRESATMSTNAFNVTSSSTSAAVIRPVASRIDSVSAATSSRSWLAVTMMVSPSASATSSSATSNVSSVVPSVISAGIVTTISPVTV